LAADLKEKYNEESELIASSHGVFEVVVDGTNIFSKKELGRFPDHSEIIESINSIN